MRQGILILMALALSLPAQEASKPAAPARQSGVNYIQRVYQVQHVDVDELVRLVSTSPGQGQTPVVRSSPALRAIAVYGTSSEVDTIMASLKSLDVPGRAPEAAGRNTFELTSYILLAAAEGEVEGAPLPDALKGVAAELEQTFGLRQIRMLEAGVLRVGSPNMVNDLGGVAGKLGRYRLRVGDARIDGRIARMRAVNFNLESPAPGAGRAEITASAEIAPGQMLVVGKSSLAVANQSLILVLSVRLD